MKISYKQRIINLLSIPDYAPLKVNEILLKLGMGRDERKKIKNLLKKMTVAKVILKLNSGGYIINNKKKILKNDFLYLNMCIKLSTTRAISNCLFSPTS